MNEHAAELRVCDLATHFREIGDTQMRDLPFYNANLEVEAWGFSSFDDDSLMGVLITPWFMNMVVFPLRLEPVQATRYGQSRTFALPHGERKFLYGGDDIVGAFWAHSLHSPMQKFASPAHARGEARARLAEALKRPPAVNAAPSPGRRAFLLGARAT
ncbi:MAG: [NiFe]-hydrogenase assembly chaperone HybE [Rhodanobacteraceae bacterium]|nr:[NiFe]-hydrogenase assembly chaperone HybE [Rhodanobacteraceae bacterium]